jgi:hypothetical protein
VGLREIREGLADRLRTIEGLRASDYVEGSISPPIAIVGFPSEIDYDLTFGREADQYTIPIRIYVGQASNRSATELLDGYLAKSGTASVKAAIEGDRTLAGACMDLDVARMTGAGVDELGAVSYLVADWEVTVVA